MKIYMAITADKYELPVGIFDGLTEMARFYNMSKSDMNTYIRRGSIRKGKEKFIKLEVEDE